MRLDTISKIEQYMADAIMTSRQIPQGVNVIRLAATNDEEGITQLARSIVVRYTGSSITVENKVPLVIIRTLKFEIQLAAQSYLTESGHDYAVQMCTGTYLTLNNRVPSSTGVQITEPLKMVQESFDGLTDSSHYIYTQVWELEVQEINRIVALDPCVARGNCSFLFPTDNIGVIEPGDVIEGNLIYVPVIQPPPGEPFDEELGGVLRDGDNLVFRADPRVVFLYDWDNYALVSTGTYDTTGTFLIVNIYVKETNELVGTYFAYNYNGRGLIQIGGNQPGGSIRNGGGNGNGSGSISGNERNWIGGMWRSQEGVAGLMDKSGGPEPFSSVLMGKNGFLTVNAIKAQIFADPTREDSPAIIEKWGVMLPYTVGSSLTVDGIEYVQVGGHALGKGWIKKIDINFVPENRMRPQLECEGEGIVDGVPEGAHPDNTGPIESCE